MPVLAFFLTIKVTFESFETNYFETRNLKKINSNSMCIPIIAFSMKKMKFYFKLYPSKCVAKKDLWKSVTKLSLYISLDGRDEIIF
jgi:hypothetical protein